MRLIATAAREFPRVLPLMRSPGVPLWAKVTLVLAAIFVVSPLNVLGDIPLLGWLDDAALLAFIIHQFVNLAERSGTQSL